MNDRTALFAIAVRYLRLSDVAIRETWYTYFLLLVISTGNAIGRWDEAFPKFFVVILLLNIWFYIRNIRRLKNEIYLPVSES